MKFKIVMIPAGEPAPVEFFWWTISSSMLGAESALEAANSGKSIHGRKRATNALKQYESIRQGIIAQKDRWFIVPEDIVWPLEPETNELGEVTL